MIPVEESILTAVSAASATYGVDTALILAVAMVESSLRPGALGDYTAEGIPESYGLMQLHVRGAGFGHTPEELLDLNNNVNWGTAYLKNCIDSFPGDIHTAISAYNQGIAGARSRGWSLNASYVNAVIGWMGRFGAEGTDTTPDLPELPGCWEAGATGVSMCIGLVAGLLEVLK